MVRLLCSDRKIVLGHSSCGTQYLWCQDLLRNQLHLKGVSIYVSNDAGNCVGRDLG